MFHNWTLAWSWLALAVGISFVTKALRYQDEEGAIFPGTILLVTAGGILAQQQGWIVVEPWRIWPLFFAAAGLGLALLWGLSDGKLWLLAPAGVLMLAGGYGLATRSWYRYLRQLRTFADLWPAVIILIGLVLIFGWWRSRAQQKRETDEQN